MGYTRNEWSLTRMFFLERGETHINRPKIFFGRNFDRAQKFLHQQIGNPQSKIRKMTDFQNFVSFDLIDFRYRFQVQNTSPGPPGLISGSISSFRPLSADLSIFDVLVKISFFLPNRLNRPIFRGESLGRKWPEGGKIAGNVFS